MAENMVLLFIGILTLLSLFELSFVGTFNFSPILPASVVAGFLFITGISQANILTAFVLISIIGYVLLANANKKKNPDETKFNIDRLIGETVEINQKYLENQTVEVDGEIWKAEKIEAKLNDKAKISGIKGNILQLEL